MTGPIILVAVLVLSVVIHENAHGWVALSLGDRTAKDAGRLTLNPVKHLDPVGSLILPAVMAFSTGSAFGYAKPVPISPWRLRGKDKGGFAVVAIAGPISNFVLAFIGVVAVRSVQPQGLTLTSRILEAIVTVNLALAAFNLLPIPPLDGSRLLRLFLRPKGVQFLDRMEPYGFLVLFLLFVLLPDALFRVVTLIQSGLVRLLPL